MTPTERDVSNLYGCGQPVALSWRERRDIAPETLKAIRSLHQIRSLANLRIIVFLAIWVAMGAATYLPLPAVVHVTPYLIMGAVIVGFSSLMHEGTHNLLCRNNRWNYILGVLCGIPALVSMSAYRAMHLYHHKHERVDHDPDDPESAAKRLHLPLALFYYLFTVIGTYPYVFYVAKTGYRMAARRRKRRIVGEYALIGGMAFAAFALVPLDALLRWWILPWIIGAHLAAIRGLVEHGVTGTGNSFLASRSVESNAIVRFFQCNVNYHLEHHLFPGVPWYNLPTLHRLLRDEFRLTGASVYQSYTRFFIDFFRLRPTEIEPGKRLVPTSVVKDACR